MQTQNWHNYVTALVPSCDVEKHVFPEVTVPHMLSIFKNDFVPPESKAGAPIVRTPKNTPKKENNHKNR
eukprot:3924131-Amphidinium_carterae.1